MSGGVFKKLSTHFIKVFLEARVAELVDAPDLGSGSLGSEGSTPFARTIFYQLSVSQPSVSTTAGEFN